MRASHWWQRWSTPTSQSRNPFRDESFFDYGVAETESQQNPGESFLQNLEATTCSRSHSTNTNPFRPGFAESEREGSTADRKMKRPVKVPDNFDGKQPLWEYLMHFERCASINGWQEGEKALFLAASLTGDSRKLLAGLSDTDCKQYSTIVGRFEARFGMEKQAELHQARLHNRLQNKGESLQELASDIRSMVDLAYQDVGANIQERFAVQHFVDALIDREDRLYLRREKPASLDKALALARELESLRLLDNSSAGNRGYKLRTIGAESAKLKDELLELKAKSLAQDKILEAQQTLIKKLNEVVAQEKKAQ